MNIFITQNFLYMIVKYTLLKEKLEQDSFLQAVIVRGRGSKRYHLAWPGKLTQGLIQSHPCSFPNLACLGQAVEGLQSQQVFKALPHLSLMTKSTLINYERAFHMCNPSLGGILRHWLLGPCSSLLSQPGWEGEGNYCLPLPLWLSAQWFLPKHQCVNCPTHP